MAIARGAGTEIIRTVMLDDLDSTTTKLIVGVQHHIYTVLSIIFHAATWQAAGNYCRVALRGYDSKGGTKASEIIIFQENLNAGQTFVFNDKFSFNGYEPVNFGTNSITAAPLSAADQQDAIADQGSSVAQELRLFTQNGADSGHITVTYIDQNNA